MTYPKVNPYAVAFYNIRYPLIVPARRTKDIDKDFIRKFTDKLISINNRAQCQEFTLVQLEEYGIPQDDGTRKTFKFDEQLVNECGFNERQIEILRQKFCIKGSYKYFSSLNPIKDMDEIIVFILGNYPRYINIDTCPSGMAPNRSYELFRVRYESVDYIITYDYNNEVLREENDELREKIHQLELQVSENVVINIRLKQLEEKNKLLLDNLAIINERMGLVSLRAKKSV